MNVSDIITFLGKIGANRVRPAGKVVRASCPFESRHAKGVDKRPSFAIIIVDGGESRFNCQACKQHGSLQWLLTLLDRSGRRLNYRELTEFLLKHDRITLKALEEKLKEAKKPRPVSRTIAGINVPSSTAPEVVSQPLEDIELPTLPESYLVEYFEPLGVEAQEYLLDRGITENTAREWGLRWSDPTGRIAIPVRDCQQRLVGISGRAVRAGRGPKYLHSKGFKRDYYLFGEDKRISGPAILVEGQFDVIRLWQYGYRNVVAVLGSYMTKFQTEKVVRFFTGVTIATDGDEAGYEAAEKFAKALRARMVVPRVVVLPEGRDPGDLGEDEARELIGPPLVDNRKGL